MQLNMMLKPKLIGVHQITTTESSEVF